VEIRVRSWNIFHARDGHPDVGPSWRSTLLGTPVDSGTHLHLNQTFVAAVGEIVGRARPTVAMLQEVPPWAVTRIAEIAGMASVHALTAPRIGPAGVRGRLGRMNPDLFRTHEGNANALLVRAPWVLIPESSRTVRLNPPGLVWRTAREQRMGWRAALDWLWERRNLLTARIRHPEGPVVQVACCHCHGDRRSAAVEIPRAGRAAVDLAGDLPLVLAGDLNARVSTHPGVFGKLERLGLQHLEATPEADREIGIDHILARGLTPLGPARRWAPEEREIIVPWRGETRRVRISDHDPVEATLQLRA
jgi:endonuclease/exonuclease/phosphatase family metal-dependent hydrolase